ncbi:MAG: hypothetical protein U0793_17935 [Gemmataceae bacterium]
MAAERIDPRQAHERVASGNALLVCAYDEPDKCAKYRLEGAITLDELRRRAVGKDQEIIFYCA